MESVWIFKLGLRFLMNSILNILIFPGTFLKLLIGFLSKGVCYRELPRNVDRLPNICTQQCVDEGVGLCTRNYLHRTNHTRNDKQPIADSVDISWKLTVAITSFCYSHSDFVIIPITDCRKLINNNEKAAKKFLSLSIELYFKQKLTLKVLKFPLQTQTPATV